MPHMTNCADNKKSLDKFPKYALMISYVGSHFNGLKLNKSTPITVENFILEALREMNVLASHVWIKRACATDRNSHAVKNVVCVRLDPFSVYSWGSLQSFCSELNLQLTRVNERFSLSKNNKDSVVTPSDRQNIPNRDIFVHAIRPVHDNMECAKIFMAKSFIYLIPRTLLFNERTSIVYHASEADILLKLNEILVQFEGTHSFHNFTTRSTSRLHHDVGRKQNESNIVEIFSAGVDPDLPIIGMSGEEFYVIRIDGMDFLKHQICRMMGLVIAIMLGFCDRDAIEKSFNSTLSTSIVEAPSSYCILDCLRSYQVEDNYSRMVKELDSLFEPHLDACRMKILDEIARIHREHCLFSEFIKELKNPAKQYFKLTRTSSSYALPKNDSSTCGGEEKSID